MDKQKQIQGNSSAQNKKFDFTIYSCFFVFALIIGAAIAIAQTVMLYQYYDVSAHLFVTGAEKITSIFYIFVFIIIVAFFTIFIAARKNVKTLPELPKMTNPLMFISAMCGFMVLASAVLSIIYPSQAASQSATLAGVFSMLLKIISIPTALYFFSLIFSSKDSYIAKTVFGFFPILWCILNLMCIYFDQSTPINNPIRILSQVVMIAIMAYFLLEQRFRIGRSSVKAYFTFANIAVFLIIITAIPEIILTFSGKWQTSVETISLLSEICFGLYISARILSFKNLPSNPKKAAIAASEAPLDTDLNTDDIAEDKTSSGIEITSMQAAKEHLQESDEQYHKSNEASDQEENNSTNN